MKLTLEQFTAETNFGHFQTLSKHKKIPRSSGI